MLFSALLVPLCLSNTVVHNYYQAVALVNNLHENLLNANNAKERSRQLTKAAITDAMTRAATAVKDDPECRGRDTTQALINSAINVGLVTLQTWFPRNRGQIETELNKFVKSGDECLERGTDMGHFVGSFALTALTKDRNVAPSAQTQPASPVPPASQVPPKTQAPPASSVPPQSQSCSTHQQCQTNNNGKPFCHKKQCVQCLAYWHCKGLWNYCNGQSMCSVPPPECTNHQQCRISNPDKPICHNKKCVQCRNYFDCKGLNNHCNDNICAKKVWFK